MSGEGYQRPDISDQEAKFEKRNSKKEIRRGGKTQRPRHDPSTARPDAPQIGAKEKVGPLRSG